MDLLRNISFENKYLRHSVFWLVWVIGFTFIKSFGATLDIYLGWLVYYIVTLPIFVLHTYLVVYWLGKKFLSGFKILLFFILFIVLMYVFSAIELFLTARILSTIFPDIFSSEALYLDPVEILISGVGNLYILLVFIAAKLVRSWYLIDSNKRKMMEKSLFNERADANAGIQPNMLLFSVESIEKFAFQNREEIPGTIALLSELLNAVMQAQQLMQHRVDEELLNVKKMLRLYALFLSKEIPKLRIEGNDLHMKLIPVFILFSPLEIIFRNARWMPDQYISIRMIDCYNVDISWSSEDSCQIAINIEVLNSELDQLYPGKFKIQYLTADLEHTLRISYKETQLNEKVNRIEIEEGMPFTDNRLPFNSFLHL